MAINNNSGSIVVHILLISSVVIALSLGILNSLGQVKKNFKRTEYKLEYQKLEQKMLSIFSSPDLCLVNIKQSPETLNLRDPSVAYLNLSSILQSNTPSSPALIRVGDMLDNFSGDLIVDEIKMNQIKLMPVAQTYTAFISVKLRSLSQPEITRSLKPVSVGPIILTMNTYPSITRSKVALCFGFGHLSSSSCLPSPLTTDPRILVENGVLRCCYKPIGSSISTCHNL